MNGADLVPGVETSTLAPGRGLFLATDAVWFIRQGVVESELASGALTTLPLVAVGMTLAQGHPLPPALAAPSWISIAPPLHRLCKFPLPRPALRPTVSPGQPMLVKSINAPVCGLQVLHLLQSAGALTLSDLHRLTGIPKASILRILKRLQEGGAWSMVHGCRPGR